MEIPDYYNISDEILNFWFNNKDVWFSATKSDDLEITTKFYEYLPLYAKIDDNQSLAKTLDHNKLLSYIIMLDQMTRHFYRDEPVIWQKYTTTSCKLVKIGLQNNYDTQYSSDELCFLLMPFTIRFHVLP